MNLLFDIRILFIQVILSLIISLSFSRNKMIGFWWGFLFCLATTPIIGLFIILSSQKKELEHIIIKPAKSRFFGGIIFYLLAGGLTAHYYLESQYDRNPIVINIIFSLIVYGSFLIFRSFGVVYTPNSVGKIKNYNKNLFSLCKYYLNCIKNKNLGIYRLLKVLGVMLVIISIIIVSNMDVGDEIVTIISVMSIGVLVWLFYWLFVFIVYWIYEGFEKNNSKSVK